MCVDSCRKKSLGKTPHGKAEGGLTAPAESEVHFRSDIFTHNFGCNPDKKSYLPEVHRFLKDEADIKIYLPDHGDILEEASDKKSYVPELHHFPRDGANTVIYL